MSVRGIDIASYQGDPGWDAVAAAGYAFAFTKSTEDDGYVNPTFGRNWRETKRVNMARGAYHFARPGANDATQEADYFLDIVQSHGGGLDTGDMLALDIESGEGDLGPWCLEFLRRVEARAGFKPFVYTGKWFVDPHGFANYPELADYGLWLGAYSAAMPAPPKPWPFVAIWQYTDKGQVPGIAGDVDLNVFNGPIERLALYGKPAGGTTATPPNTLEERVSALEIEVSEVNARFARLRAALEAMTS